MFLEYVIAVLSVILYLQGFFPIPTRPSQQALPNNITDIHPKYQRAVITIIDALRLDFISDSQTPFLARTYKNTGCFIQLKVETPTVTLPRIKALTTGNVPQFVDIILNLASPTKVEDSFVHRAYAKKKKTVFYGDDIWVKLFPEQFIRSEGTSSFFVNDYTEVDNNVTRNVKLEIKRTDWNIMILHYLGLDHIGHVYGPKSPLITTKLAEMDFIMEEIYNSQNDTLFIITGDHGMRDSGGHGGSTYAETNVPLIILGMPCYNDTFAQIDIPANLAILLGFDIPSTSIGHLQHSLLHHLDTSVYLDALKYNTALLRNKLDLCQDSIDLAYYLHDLYVLEKNETLARVVGDIYLNCSREISENLQKSSVRQNLGSLLIASLSCLTILMKIFQKNYQFAQKKIVEELIILLILFLQFVSTNPIATFVSILLTLLFLIRNIATLDLKKGPWTDLSFLTVLSVIHPLTFLSSSFLEEEHQFWYFFTNTFILMNIIKSQMQKKWFLLLASVRFIRTINQVGDKWASLPDLADWLLEVKNHLYLQLIFITSLILIFYCNQLYTKNSIFKLTDFLVLILIHTFRFVLKGDIILGKTLWMLILGRLVASLFMNESFVPSWTLIITLLLKPYNTILIPFCILSSRLFHSSLKNNIIMIHWWLGNLLFFAQGHDNSLASVDISSGYIGLSEYHPLFVFPQVLCHTYALPVLSHLLLFSNKQIDVSSTLGIFVMIRLYIILIVFIVTFIHRHHLFIWSVFAPKMFVEASHFAFLIVEVSLYYIRDIINKIVS